MSTAKTDEIAQGSGGLLEELERSVEALGDQEVIDKWDEKCLRLLGAIGELFRSGLRRGVAQMIFTSTASFWPFVREFSAPETVMRVREIGRKIPFFNLQTERENAWIICSLVQGDLRIYLGVIQGNYKLVKAFYSERSGALLLDKEAVAKVDEILGRLDKCKFNLSLEEYQEYLNTPKEERPQSTAAPSKPANISADPQGEHEKLYSPIPVVATQIETLERGLLAGQISTGLSDGGVDFDFDIEDEELVEIEDKYKDIPMHEDAIEVEPSQVTKSPSFSTQLSLIDEEVAEIEHDVVQVKDDVTSATPSTFKSNQLPESREDASVSFHELTPSPTSVKREQVYGRDKVILDDVSTKLGQEEIQNITSQPRSSAVQILQDGSGVENAHYRPVILPSPSPHAATVSSRMHSPLSEISEMGFFGIPLDMGSLDGVLHPVGSLVARVGRLAWWMIASASLDDEEDDRLSSLQHDPSVFLTSEVRTEDTIKSHYGDGFAYELRICPTLGLESQGGDCYQCGQHLEDETEAKLCDVTGAYYCKACFGDAHIPVPARILKDWDFEPRPVHSETAAKYLEHFKSTVLDLAQDAPDLFSKVPILDEADLIRARIVLAMAHVKHCKSGIYAAIIKDDYKEREHLVQQRTLFSNQDLIDLHLGSLSKVLKETLAKLGEHIKSECDFCNLRGRYCQLCKVPEPIYPFDEDICECPQCGMLSHKSCSETVDHCVNCRRVYMSIMSPSIDLPSSIE